MLEKICKKSEMSKTIKNYGPHLFACKIHETSHWEQFIFSLSLDLPPMLFYFFKSFILNIFFSSFYYYYYQDYLVKQPNQEWISGISGNTNTNRHTVQCYFFFLKINRKQNRNLNDNRMRRRGTTEPRWQQNKRISTEDVRQAKAHKKKRIYMCKLRMKKNTIKVRMAYEIDGRPPFLAHSPAAICPNLKAIYMFEWK